MIFLSYARDDRLAAERLAEEFMDQDIGCLMDPVLPESAPFWREGVRNQLSQCTAMVALESPAAKVSPWTNQERRAFCGPILSVALNQPESRDHSYVSIPVESRDLLGTIQRLGVKVRSVSQPARSRRSSRARAHEQRMSAISNSVRWFEEFRAKLCGRHAALESDGPNIINSIDGSWMRPLPNNTDIYLATAPVSNSQYATFLASNRLPAPPTWQSVGYCHPEIPVTGVTWFEAAAYAAWAGGMLPSESEWEQAAKGQRINVDYATATGGIGPELAWFDQPFAEAVPRPYIDFPGNDAGFFGLSGNIWEWVTTPWDQHRVLKGGSLMDTARFCRISTRYRNAPIDRDCCVGFRIKVERPT